MESFFFFVVGALVGFLSTLLAMWTLGLVASTIYVSGLLFTRPKLAWVGLPTYLFFLCIATALCWGDFHLIQWLADNWRPTRIGMMGAALFPGVFMLQIPFGMVRDATKTTQKWDELNR